MPTTPHGRRWTASRQPISHVGRSREPIVRGASTRRASCSRNLSAAAVGRSSLPITSTAGRPMSAVHRGDQVVGALDEQCAQLGGRAGADRGPRARDHACCAARAAATSEVKGDMGTGYSEPGASATGASALPSLTLPARRNTSRQQLLHVVLDRRGLGAAVDDLAVLARDEQCGTTRMP